MREAYISPDGLNCRECGFHMGLPHSSCSYCNGYARSAALRKLFQQSAALFQNFLFASPRSSPFRNEKELWGDPKRTAKLLMRNLIGPSKNPLAGFLMRAGDV